MFISKQIKKWKITFYKSQRNIGSVEEFILNLDVATRAKVARTIDLLETYGPKLTMPHSKKINHKIYELRIRGKIEIRIFYAFVKNIIWLLHAFQKKSQKIPKREYEIAVNHLKELS